MDKAIVVFIYLHPDVNGTDINMNRLKKVSAATGANVNTVRHWFSLTVKQAAANIAVWYQIAKILAWADVKKRFPELWTNQFAIPNGATVLEELKPFCAVALKSQTLIVTKFSNNNLSTAKGRVVAARKNSNIKYVRIGKHKATTHLERNDKGKARKYPDQTDAVCAFVREH
jgi:hypothetical protein